MRRHGGRYSLRILIWEAPNQAPQTGRARSEPGLHDHQSAQTCGLDVSDRYSHFCLIDSDGHVRATGRVPTTEAGVREEFTKLETCRVVLEVGTRSPWLMASSLKLTQNAGAELNWTPDVIHERQGRMASSAVAVWNRSP